MKLDFFIKNVENDMKLGSKLIFTLPARIYTKILSINPNDCEVTIQGIQYSGCQYVNDNVNDNIEWLQYVYVNNLGFNVVPSGTIIKVSLYLTNPFTAYSFTNKFISIASITPENQ